MIRPAGLVLSVVMVGVAAGTYYGLDYIPLPPPIGRAAPDATPAVGASQAHEVASAAPAADAAAVPAPASAPATEEPMTEQDLAEEPTPASMAAAPAAEPPPAAVAEPETEPASEPATTAAPPPAPASTAAEKPEPGWAQPSKKSAGAAPKSPAPATESPASREVARAGAAESPKTSAKQKPEADVIKPWWPNPDKMPPDQLKLQYAGQVQGQAAIALLFSAPLNLETLKAGAKVRSLDGKDVGGQWELGKNPRLAVYKGAGVKPGRYTVILTPQIADAQGFMLGTTLQGPVYITERQ